MEIHEYDLPNGKLCFDPKKHRYIFDGEVIPGCTSLVKGLAPTDILIAWGCKLMGEHIEENLGKINPSDPVEVAELIRESKGQWRKKRDRLADIGTLVHNWIEGYLKHRHWGTELPTMPVNENAANACRGFVQWMAGQKVVIHALETKVLNTGLHGVQPYAGTIDVDWTLNGYRTLCDFKTSARINPEMAAQLGGYDMALEDMHPGVSYDQHMIIRIDRDTGEIETKIWPTQGEIYLNRQVFLACYRLWMFRQSWEG